MKKNTRLLVGIILATVLMLSTASAVTSFAAVNEEQSDIVFNQAMQQILEEENIASGEVVSQKEVLHDMAFEPLGYIYDFSIHTIDGYAIVINDNGFIAATELYLNADNPYADKQGLAVYPYESLYLDFSNGEYTDLVNGNVLTSEQVGDISEVAYFGVGNNEEFTQEIIAYAYKSKDEYNLAKKIPCYFGSGVNGGCVSTAAANLMWFYDRYYDNLIPNFTAGRALGSYYMYNGVPNADFESMANTISFAMGTSSAGGTTIAGFKTGMQTYSNSKGFNIGYNSCMTGSSFDYEKAKAQLSQNKPLMLFLNSYNVNNISTSGGSDILDKYFSSATHSMAGFGYLKITYTLSNGGSRTDSYINVAAATSHSSTGYLNVNAKVVIDDCYGINIYN